MLAQNCYCPNFDLWMEVRNWNPLILLRNKLFKCFNRGETQDNAKWEWEARKNTLNDCICWLCKLSNLHNSPPRWLLNSIFLHLSWSPKWGGGAIFSCITHQLQTRGLFHFSLWKQNPDETEKVVGRPNSYHPSGMQKVEVKLNLDARRKWKVKIVEQMQELNFLQWLLMLKYTTSLLTQQCDGIWLWISILNCVS